LGATEAVFFAEDAVDAVFFAAVAAFFTTGAAFFLMGAERFVAAGSTLPEGVLFPAREDGEAAARDAGTLLTWAALLAGVIVPPSDHLGWPFSPTTTSTGERVTIPDREGWGNNACHPVGG
jgi:hypothetical protein